MPKPSLYSVQRTKALERQLKANGIFFGRGILILPEQIRRVNQPKRDRSPKVTSEQSAIRCPGDLADSRLLVPAQHRAFVLFELKEAKEFSLLEPYERTLDKCCIDPLRPPGLSDKWFWDERSIRI
jgi:hypothetical protein